MDWLNLRRWQSFRDPVDMLPESLSVTLILGVKIRFDSGLDPASAEVEACSTIDL